MKRKTEQKRTGNKKKAFRIPFVKNKSLPDEEKDDESFDGLSASSEDLTFEDARKELKDRLAPDGINPNPLEYMVVEDHGVKAYAAVLYVQTMPRSDTFAVTFAPLFNYPGVTSSVYIDPLPAKRAMKMLDKRIVSLDAERISAEKSGDANRIRRISEKLADTQEWARAVETQNTSLSKVRIMFTITAESARGLQDLASAFSGLAAENGIELSNAYSVIPEAYLCTAPLNRMFDFAAGPFRQNIIKYHIMDNGSLSNVFNHTQFSFSHENGVFLGRDMHTGLPFYYDAFEKSHNGYAVIIAGGTGTGKSTTVKALASRNIDFGAKIVAIDYDAPGSIGEYAQLAYETGGVIYSVKATSDTVLNLFELEKEIEYDELTGRERVVLDLAGKIADVTNIILTIIKTGKNTAAFDVDTFLEDKISEIVSELYAECGIIDQEPNSLYETGQTVRDGRLVAGLVKKALPTVTDFVYKTLIAQRNNRDENYSKVYAIIIAGMKNYVRELYYCKDTIRRFSREEYSSFESDARGKFYTDADGQKHYVGFIKGVKPYFDGESTIHPDLDTPMVDFDISQLPPADKPVAQMVVMNYINENFIKKNSKNPSKIQNLIFIVDEAHRTFPYPEARRFISDIYRTARKHHVSPWTITQALMDYATYPETEAMIKNAASIFLLKQSFQDREFIEKTTPLTPTQIDELMDLGGDTLMYGVEDEDAKNARRGEVCLIDNGLVAFIKVDIIWSSERRYVTTDAESRQKMYREMQSR